MPSIIETFGTEVQKYGSLNWIRQMNIPINTPVMMLQQYFKHEIDKNMTIVVMLCVIADISHGLHGFISSMCPYFLYPPPCFNEAERGYTGITLSVCPSVCLSICPSVDRIVSVLYLQQYSSDPFYICTSYQATSEGVSRVMPVSKFKNL